MSCARDVGRIVHYVSHGTPPRPDGSQAFTSKCRAAIITEVLEPAEDGTARAALCVLNPTGQFFNQVSQSEQDHGAGGTWHWPEGA